jgi:hypothetical protein
MHKREGCAVGADAALSSDVGRRDCTRLTSYSIPNMGVPARGHPVIWAVQC